MEKTIRPGDIIWVNKLIIGPQLPDSPYKIPWLNIIFWIANPSNTNTNWWQYYRLKGYSKVKSGDILVFNHPQNNEIFIKRCIGLPGDTLKIINAQVHINGKEYIDRKSTLFKYKITFNDSINSIKTAKELGFNQYLNEQTKQISQYLEIIHKENALLHPGIKQIVIDNERADTAWLVFPHSPELKWNIDFYGPLKIPHKGMMLQLNTSTYKIYAETIRKCEGIKIDEINNQYYIDKSKITEYVFKNDYFFMLGDNRHDSNDSRYFGFVPESKIIGKATITLFSPNNPSVYQRILRPLN